MKKRLLIILLAIVMCFALTGCGKEKTNGGENTNQGENTQQKDDTQKQEENNTVSDSLGWPDNDFTKQVPKPEQSFSEEAASDNSACYIYPIWTTAEAREYVEKLKNNGYHVSSTMVDSEDDYLIYLKNADESYQVTISVDGTSSSLAISIPFDKR